MRFAKLSILSNVEAKDSLYYAIIAHGSHRGGIGGVAERRQTGRAP
jgi:hypothetical protein